MFEQRNSKNLTSEFELRRLAREMNAHGRDGVTPETRSQYDLLCHTEKAAVQSMMQQNSL